MTDHDNFARLEKCYDSWLTENLELEKAHAKETAIENKTLDLYQEMLDDPELLAEALQESYSEDWAKFAAALGNAIRRETPAFDVQYLKKITDTGSELLIDYCSKQAQSWWEGL
jgi:hypothetical protein